MPYVSPQTAWTASPVLNVDGSLPSRRLTLPRSALLSPGVLTLHLLPPPSTSTPLDHPTPAPSSPNPLPHPHAPLCFLPLLVLPAAAAREVVQLHAYAVARELGWAEEGHEGEGMKQQQDIAEGRVSSDTRVSNLLAGTRGGTAAEAVAAMSALHRNGMYSLSYDFAALLDLPYSAADSTAADGSDPAPDPWVFCGVLRLLAEQGMGACLRMGLGAMQRAGMRLQAGGGGGAAGAGAETGTARNDDDREVTVDAAVQLLLDRPAAGCFQVGLGVRAEGVAKQHDASGGAGCTGAGEQQEARVPSASSAGAPDARAAPHSYRPRLDQAPPEAVAAAVDTTGAAASTSSLFSCRSSATLPSPPTPPLPALDPPRGPSWRWWLCALLLGFRPAALEAAYQRYKTACCWSSDRVALLTHAVMAIMTLVRMLRKDGGAGAGGVAGEAHGAAGGAGGGYDPQLAAHGLWLGVSLASLLVLLLTTLHDR